MNQIDIKKVYRGYNKMYMATIELTTLCNFDCIHCYLEEHDNPGLPTEKVFKLLRDLRSTGVYEVQFTGGEIFLRRDILDIIGYARELKLKVVLLTNLYYLTPSTIYQLESLGVESISTTLFSMDEAINDEITRKEGSYQRIIQNALFIARTNIRLEIKTVLLALNETELIPIKEFCKANGINFLATEGVFPKNDGDTSPRELALSEAALTKNIQALDEIRFGSKYYCHKEDGDSICCELHYSLFIDARGYVYPCSLLHRAIGNVEFDDIGKIWETSELLMRLKTLSISDLHGCRDCADLDYCIRCTGIADSLGNDFWGIDHFSCRTARIRRTLYGQEAGSGAELTCTREGGDSNEEI